MKQATLTLIIFALAFACQRETSAPEAPEIKSWYFYLYSQKAQDATSRTCVHNQKPFTNVSRGRLELLEYQSNYKDAVVQDSVFTTMLDAMGKTACGQTFNIEAE